MALVPLCLSWQGLPGETRSQKELQDRRWKLVRMVRVSFSFRELESVALLANEGDRTAEVETAVNFIEPLFQQKGFLCSCLPRSHRHL